MKKIKLFNIIYFTLVTVLLSASLFTGCGGESDDGITYVETSLSDAYSGSGDKIFYPSTSGNVELTYSLDLGSNTKKVYFVFTNSNTGKDVSVPELMNISYSTESFSVPSINKSSMPSVGINNKPATRGKPEITAFYETARELLQNDGKRTYNIESSETGSKVPLKAYTVGNTSSLNDDDGNPVPATVRKVVIEHGKTLVLWVANDCWHDTGSGKDHYIDDALANDMANAFLLSGDNNDIYEWITGIFGDEWGSEHSFNNIIGVTNEIHILLYDIDNDNSINGGTLGFFHPRDTFKTSSDSKSNERIMFYMDSVLFATSDYWKSELISTLAHEFQHIIHWYQKEVVLDTPSDTWLNEMCSLVAEDFVADKLEVDGPRGVKVENGDYTARLANNTEGRLPLFNYWNDAPLTTWLADDEALRSYSIAYAFGAYLARNHGGAQLFRNIVQNNYGDHRAIGNAISGYTFTDLLREWGASVVLSDKTVQLPDLSLHGYNKDAAFTSTLSPITYNLGSINLYNYKYDSLNGPWYYSLSSLESNKDILYRGSNTYVYAGSLTELQEWTFRMKDGVSLTVIVRD